MYLGCKKEVLNIYKIMPYGFIVILNVQNINNHFAHYFKAIDSNK